MKSWIRSIGACATAQFADSEAFDIQCSSVPTDAADVIVLQFSVDFNITRPKLHARRLIERLVTQTLVGNASGITTDDLQYDAATDYGHG